MDEILQFPPMRRLYATDGELQLHQDNYPQFMYWIAEVDRER